MSRQWRLLDLQKLDTRLDQLAHRAAHLPVLEQVAQSERECTRLHEESVLAATAVSDVEREIAKADQDVQMVRDRAARNTQRLDSGQGSAKELQGLQHELQTLARRQNELEELELEVMERAEELRAAHVRLEAERAEAQSTLDRLSGERDATLAQVEAERTQVQREREQLVPGLGAELVALYETSRQRHAGVGAAALVGRRCDGCGLELNPADLSRLRTAAEDEVLRCEECGRILVRTAESGL